MALSTGAKIGIGVGAVLLLRGGGSILAAPGSVPGNAQANQGGLLGTLQNALSSFLKPKTSTASKPSSGGFGVNPAGGAGSGRSVRGVTPVLSLEDSMNGLGFFTTDQIQAPTEETVPDVNTTIAAVAQADQSGQSDFNSIIASLTPTGTNAIPQLAPQDDPNSGFVDDGSNDFFGI